MMKFKEASMKLLLAVLFVMVAAHHTAYAAGFDCNKAASPTEKAICADPTLSALDDSMTAAFNAALKRWADPIGAQALREDQRFWLKESRNDVCKADKDCLKRNYEIRIAYLKNPLSAYVGRYVSGRCLKSGAKSDGMFLDIVLQRDNTLNVELYVCPNPRGNMLLQFSGSINDKHVMAITQTGGCRNTLSLDAGTAVLAAVPGARSCAAGDAPLTSYKRDPKRSPYLNE
jgi:uncharacterized protein